MSETSQRPIVLELLVGLARAIQTMRVYQEDHTLVKQAIQQLTELIDRLLGQQESFVIGLIGDEIIFEDGPLPPSEKRFSGLINLFNTFSIQKIRFARGLTQDELKRFIKLLAIPPQLVKKGKSFQERFAELNLNSLALGGFGGSSNISGQQEQLFDQDFFKDDKGGVELLTKAFRDLKGSPAMNVHSARQIVEGLLNNIVKNKNLLPILTSMRASNEDMFDHGVNVSVFTLLQAEILGIEEKHLVDVGMAALLHDIGDLSEDGENHVDLKMTPEMTKEEMFKQRRRDVDGAKILLDSEGIPKLAAIVAFEKNMRYDMKGLPRKIYGKQLNLISMMIAISDYYDKLRKRPEFYEEGGPEKAYEEMNTMSGTYFQPDLLKNFFSVVGIYPPGALVELDTQEIALVIQGNVMDIKRPQVEILYDADGKKYDDPIIVNLIERDNRGQFKRSIVKSISMSEHFSDSGTDNPR